MDIPIYVDLRYGDDSTGVPGETDKPFKTLLAAVSIWDKYIHGKIIIISENYNIPKIHVSSKYNRETLLKNIKNKSIPIYCNDLQIYL